MHRRNLFKLALGVAFGSRAAGEPFSTAGAVSSKHPSACTLEVWDTDARRRVTYWIEVDPAAGWVRRYKTDSKGNLCYGPADPRAVEWEPDGNGDMRPKVTPDWDVPLEETITGNFEVRRVTVRLAETAKKPILALP